MDHYLDIALLPDPEFSQNHLMDALFAKLHRALVAAGCGDLGISFPQVREQGTGLGTVLRLHGSAARLIELMAANWLAGMRDHTTLSTVQAVPSTCTSFCIVSRVQAKSSPARERRRLMRRKGLTEEQAIARIPDHCAEMLHLPYVQMRSQSTGERFLLFIRHGHVQVAPTEGTFSAYGLSPTGTIPWF
jgi:CRISPR-associated endonuclease Csy4